MVTIRALFKFVGKGRIEFGLEVIVDKELGVKALNGDADAQEKITQEVLDHSKNTGWGDILGARVKVNFGKSFHHHDLKPR